MRLPLIILAAAAVAAPALASTYRSGPLEADHPWIRLAAPGAMTAAGYVTLSNTGAKPERLVGASSPAARKVTVHQSAEAGGMMSMTPVKALAIAPGSKVAFSPGGYHLMLSGFTASLKAGQAVPVTLLFESGAALKAQFQVEVPGAPAASGPAMDPHMHMH